MLVSCGVRAERMAVSAGPKRSAALQKDFKRYCNGAFTGIQCAIIALFNRFDVVV
jgi:hypothetical protein